VLPLQAEAPAVPPRQSAPAKKEYVEIQADLGFAWSKESLGNGGGMGVYFSPLPYVSIGMTAMEWASAIADVSGNHDSGIAVIRTFLPIHAGVAFPITKRIVAMCYGTVNWLGSVDGVEPLLHGGHPSGFGVFITPGIKADLLFEVDEGWKVGLMYKGYWFAGGRYLNTIGFGLAVSVI
jgi:hypothetical protein